MRDEEFGEGTVPADVFTHAVHHLNDRPRLASLGIPDFVMDAAVAIRALKGGLFRNGAHAGTSFRRILSEGGEAPGRWYPPGFPPLRW